MSHQYTEVEHISWGKRITNSFVGVILGFALFFGSFFILYWNEGRINFSQIAKQAVEISATSSNTVPQGKLIFTTGSVTSEEVIGDNLFLKPGQYIAVKRFTEMFAWDETKTSKTKKNVGGSEEKITTYRYEKKWHNQPEDSSRFKKSAGHHNPAKSISDLTNRVSQAQIGIYDLDIERIDLPRFQKLQLNQQNTNLKDGVSLVGNYLFQGNGTLNNPQVGDLRLQYSIIPNNMNMTVFGKLDKNRITAYLDQGKNRFYRMFSGSREEAISLLQHEYKTTTWLLRLLGFVMMWMGLTLFIEPIGVVLDVLPFLGNITRGIAGVSSFIIAFVMSSITILISMLLHNLVALAIAVAVAIGAGIFLRKMQQKAI
ncbi:MAG: TMEM43 family protein [Cyanobacteria bacterium P01_G01_bin.39]